MRKTIPPPHILLQDDAAGVLCLFVRLNTGLFLAALCALITAGQKTYRQWYGSAAAADLAAGSLLLCGAALALAVSLWLPAARPQKAFGVWTMYAGLTAAALFGCILLWDFASAGFVSGLALLAVGFGLGGAAIALGFAVLS